MYRGLSFEMAQLMEDLIGDLTSVPHINPAGDSLDVEIDQVKAAISAQWRPMFRKPSEIRGSCPTRCGSNSVALTRS